MIEAYAKRGSRLVMIFIAAAVLLGAYVTAQVRLNGPIDRVESLQNELLADILPPPAFVVEPFLLTTLLVEDRAHPGAIERLKALKAETMARRDYWKTAPLPEEVSDQTATTIKEAEAFWQAVDTEFLPALTSGDVDRARQVHRERLLPLYNHQQQNVLTLVGQSNAFRQDYAAYTERTMIVSLAILAVLMLGIIAVVGFAARLVSQRVVRPLLSVSATLHRMAAGDLETVVDGTDLPDEIGEICRAAETFRAAGVAKREADEEQRRVVEELTRALACMAKGDLEYRIRTPFSPTYEGLRADFNQSVSSLARSIGDVRVGAASVMRSLADLRAAADDLAKRNEVQAESLARTAATMNSVTRGVSETAAGAAGAQSLIVRAHGKASDGGDVVRRAVAAMAAIEKSSTEIAQIIAVIDGIAFQTSLLALNAGVEAARAGQAGSGFAVVAGEVRALAQRCTEAAQTITELIGSSSHEVSTGVTLVGETGSILEDLLGEFDAITDRMAEIAGVADTQARHLGEVNRAVADMDGMTQQNAAMVEQSSAATRSLADEAVKLTELVSAFRTRDVDARSTHVGQPEALRRTTLVEPRVSPQVRRAAA